MEVFMIDLVYILLVLIFFAGCIGAIDALESLKG
jgi:hypothetical protein